MRNQLFFNGKALSDFGVEVKGDAVYNSPQRDVESISVPGRNGDLLIDNGRYSNIQVTYPAFILRTFQGMFDAFRAFMLANTGYHRIQDTYHPEEYRIGRLSSQIEAKVYELGSTGTFDLTFDCKPQRFLVSGEKKIVFTNVGALKNPTHYDAKPLIKVNGIGIITINDTSVQVEESGITIDCDMQEAYKDGVYKNDKIVLENGIFPVLKSGINSIEATWDDTTEQSTTTNNIEITPRWWTL